MNNPTLSDTRRHNFFIIDNDVIDAYGDKLGPYGIAVYCLLVRHANKDGTCFPSYTTIANKLKISRPKAIEMIKLLIDLKLVGKTSRGNDSGEATSNEYTILQVVNVVNHPSKPGLLPVVNDVNPKNTNSEQDEVKKEKRVAKRQTQAAPSSPVQAIKTAFVETKQKHEPGCVINHGETGAAAKAIEREGWTPEQVIQCAEILYKDSFYSSSSLSLWSVAKQIGAKVRRVTFAAPPVVSGGDFGLKEADRYVPN